MTLVELSFVPTGNGGKSSPHVNRVMRMIRRSGLRHTMGPEGACLEGTWEEISRLLGHALDELSLEGERIGVVIKVEYPAVKEPKEEDHTGSMLGRMPALIP